MSNYVTPPEVLLANADYEATQAECRKRGKDYRFTETIRIFEKRWKLPARKLANFRANMKRRKTPLPDGGY